MASAAITEDEAAIYDRQIRVWGLDAQKRMRAANILIVGVDGLTGEVMKNIVLAGVNSVTILDDTEVNDSHLHSMFFVNKDHLGKKIAEVVKEGLSKLNPLVQINTEVCQVSSKDDVFFTNYHVICMSCMDLPTLSHINNLCHKNKIKFFCGSVYGFYGYLFSDLGDHEYAEQEKVIKTQPKANDDDGPPEAKKAKTDNTPETVTVKKTCSYESLQTVLNVKLKQLSSKQLKKIAQDYFIMRVLLDFCTKKGSKPTKADYQEVVEQADKTMAALEIDSTYLDNRFIPLVCEPELSAVCAVVGGVLGQEILTAVSQQNAPIDNYFFFNPERCAGYKERIHSSITVPVKPAVIADTSIIL